MQMFSEFQGEVVYPTSPLTLLIQTKAEGKVRTEFADRVCTSARLISYTLLGNIHAPDIHTFPWYILQPHHYEYLKDTLSIVYANLTLYDHLRYVLEIQSMGLSSGDVSSNVYQACKRVVRGLNTSIIPYKQFLVLNYVPVILDHLRSRPKTHTNLRNLATMLLYTLTDIPIEDLVILRCKNLTTHTLYNYTYLKLQSVKGTTHYVPSLLLPLLKNLETYTTNQPSILYVPNQPNFELGTHLQFLVRLLMPIPNKPLPLLDIITPLRKFGFCSEVRAYCSYLERCKEMGREVVKPAHSLNIHLHYLITGDIPPL